MADENIAKVYTAEPGRYIVTVQYEGSWETWHVEATSEEDCRRQVESNGAKPLRIREWA